MSKGDKRSSGQKRAVITYKRKQVALHPKTKKNAKFLASQSK